MFANACATLSLRECAQTSNRQNPRDKAPANQVVNPLDMYEYICMHRSNILPH